MFARKLRVEYEENGQRLAITAFALAKFANGLRRGRVAKQMKAAHALHSQDLAIPQQAGRLLEDR